MGFNLLDRLIPRDAKFFSHLNKHTDFLVKGASALNDLISHLGELSDSEIKERITAIKFCESEMDRVEASIIDELHENFLTPIDQEDISTLAVGVDQAMDLINAVSCQIDMYKLHSIPSSVPRICEVIVTMSVAFREMLHLLEAHKDVNKQYEQIHKLENNSDDLYLESLSDLFNGQYTAQDILKYKEIIEILEECSDTIDHAAKQIRIVRIKQT